MLAREEAIKVPNQQNPEAHDDLNLSQVCEADSADEKEPFDFNEFRHWSYNEYYPDGISDFPANRKCYEDMYYSLMYEEAKTIRQFALMHHWHLRMIDCGESARAEYEQVLSELKEEERRLAALNPED